MPNCLSRRFGILTNILHLEGASLRLVGAIRCIFVSGFINPVAKEAGLSYALRESAAGRVP